MSAPAQLNFTAYRGDTFARTLTFQDGAATPTAIDLTDYSASAQVRASADSTKLLATFTCTITAPTEGTMTLGLLPSDTSSLDSGRYFWDLQLTDSNGAVTTYLAGRFTLTGDVTK